MKNETGLAYLGLMTIASLFWTPSAHAQHTSWWDQQKAKAAQANGNTANQAPTAQGNATPAPPVEQRIVSSEQSHTHEKQEGPTYTFVEAGVGRMDISSYGIKESGNGGYVRGSTAINESLYAFSGYNRASKSWHGGTERLKIAIDQTELGIGSNVRVSPRTDFISELSYVRLGGEVKYSDQAFPDDNISGSDHLNAAKLMLGFNGNISPNFNVWAKAGYLQVNSNYLIENSGLGNIGFQYRFTPNWGLVGEAEFYDDVRFYRLGIRANF